MHKKYYVSIVLTLILTLIVVMSVLAGTTRDRGTLETKPPAGKVNWTAWLLVSDGQGEVVHPPYEIMTEDSFNAAQGPGGGYTDEGWQIQVENMRRETAGIEVDMMFCGLDDLAGKNWWHTFEWDISESTTDHSEVPFREETSFTAPPMDVEFVDDAYIVRFSGEADTKYYVYRSQNPAAEGANRSNGRYTRIGAVTTDSQGIGEYQDDDFNSDFPAWYMVMYFAETFDGLHGCHGETGPLLKQCVFDFVAEYKADTNVVELTWKAETGEGITGFNVYRSESKTGTREKLNDAPIDATPPGGPFAFTDDNLGNAKTYYYWIEIIGGASCLEMAGPVLVEIPQVGGPYYYYIPLVTR